MAKKKKPRSEPGKDKPRKARKRTESGFDSDSVEFGAFPDPRTMEGLFQSFIEGGLGKPKKRGTPLDKAQRFIEQALDEEDDEKRAALVRKALETSPDCVDAYVLMAEDAATDREALDLYRQATAIGRRVLGEEAFQKNAGKFLFLPETWPYLRALFGLAQMEWVLGHRDQALNDYQELLRLDPNDQNGVRILAVSGYIEAGRDADAEAILNGYPDEAYRTDWVYTRALLQFRKEGDSPAARKLLTKAQEVNPHVPDFMLAVRQLPLDLPNYVSDGDEDEAVAYAANFLLAWRASAGAISWLRSHSELSEPEDMGQFDEGPDLSTLPVDEDEVWQAELVPLPGKAFEEGGEDWQLFLVSSPTDNTVVYFEPLELQPDSQRAWECFAEAMRRPYARRAHRPGRIEVKNDLLADALRIGAPPLGIEIEQVEVLDHLQTMVDEFADRFAELNPPRANRKLELSQQEIIELDQAPEEVWQLDYARLPVWIGDAGPERPWAVLVVNHTEDTILSNDLRGDEPGPKALIHQLFLGMAHPAVGQPHRPARVEVREPAMQKQLETKLAKLGIECVVSEDFSHWDFCLETLVTHLAGSEGPPSLIGVPNVTMEQVAATYGAAADFYRKAPWRHVPGDFAFRLDSPKIPSGPWYAVVMGQSGVTLGLAVYEGRETLAAALSGELDEHEHLRRTSSVTVTFGEAFEIPPKDLYFAEKNHWPIAAPEAYPLFVRVNPGMAVRAPLSWELQLLEAALRGVLAAIERHGEKVTTEKLEIETPTFLGPVQLTITPDNEL